MGAYNRWYIDVNTDDEDILNSIKDFGEKISSEVFFNGPSGWASFCFRTWSPSTKWYPDSLVSALSVEFSALIFSVNVDGDEGHGEVFFYQGKDIEENKVFPRPRFPSVTVLKKAIKDAAAKDLEAAVASEKAYLAKLVEDKQKTIKTLEAELKVVKNDLKALTKK